MVQTAQRLQSSRIVTGLSPLFASNPAAVAIATRHADAVDVRFDVNDRPMWIALPCTAWVEQKKRAGKVITDQLAAQVAGRYLKQLIEEGYDSRREMYTMSVEEVLSQLDAVVAEATAQHGIPSLPVGIEAAG